MILFLKALTSLYEHLSKIKKIFENIGNSVGI